MTQPGERERLVAELRQVGDDWQNGRTLEHVAADLLEADGAELAALRKNAERYHHMRAWFLRQDVRHNLAPNCHIKQYTMAELDAAIDVALATPTLADEKGGEG